MTKKELARVYVIKSLIEDKMTSQNAVEVLSLRECQIKRLKAEVKKDGEVNCTPPPLEETILEWGNRFLLFMVLRQWHQFQPKRPEGMLLQYW